MGKEIPKLLGTWSSLFVLRIKWALKMKGVEYEFIEEDLSNKSSLLLELNPVHKKVPVFIHEGRAISESLLILEYIDETWRENPILSDDPYDRAMARFWSMFGEDKVMPSIWRLFTSQEEEREETLLVTIETIEILENELHGKKFFGGETLGYADLALGWMADMIELLEEIMELKLINDERFPSLCAWFESFKEFPTIKDSFPPRDRMITKYVTIRESILSSK